MSVIIKTVNEKEKAKVILEDIAKEISNPKILDDLIISNDVKDGYPKPCLSWTFSNIMLMVRQGTQDARGVNQWKEFKDKSGKVHNVNRTPIKNHRTVHIFRPIFSDICKKCELHLWKGQCNKCKITKTSNPNEVKQVFDKFGTLQLIPVEDTIGKELPEFKPKKRPNLEFIAKKMGIKLVYRELIGLHGYYHTLKKEIVLATTDQTVFFHELAHAIDHKLNKDFKIQNKAKSEAIAEITACVIARMYGIECIGQSQNYLSKYCKGKSYVSNMVMGVLKQIGNILDFIFEEEKPKKKGVKK